jgi:hypothetical protein
LQHNLLLVVSRVYTTKSTRHQRPVDIQRVTFLVGDVS